MRKVVIPFMMMLAFACAPVAQGTGITSDSRDIKYNHGDIINPGRL